MAISVQTNSAAITALKNLNINNANMNASLTKLSTGFRINSAADDAAGFAISSKLDSQVMRMKAASLNATQAQAMTKTADAGVNEIQNMVTRIQSLATQAASANNAGELAKLDAERVKLESAINKIANGTNYNGINLLNGLDAQTGAAVAQIVANIGTVTNTRNAGAAASVGTVNNVTVGQGALLSTITDNVTTGIKATVGGVTNNRATGVAASVGTVTNVRATGVSFTVSSGTQAASATAATATNVAFTAATTVTSSATLNAGSSSGTLTYVSAASTFIAEATSAQTITVTAITTGTAGATASYSLVSSTNLFSATGSIIIKAGQVYKSNVTADASSISSLGFLGATTGSTNFAIGDKMVLDIAAGTRLGTLKVDFGVTTGATVAAATTGTLTARSTAAFASNGLEVKSSVDLFSKTTGALALAKNTYVSAAEFTQRTGIQATTNTTALGTHEIVTNAISAGGTLAKAFAVSVNATGANFNVAGTNAASFTVTATDTLGAYTVTSDTVLYDSNTGQAIVAAGVAIDSAQFAATTGLNITVDANASAASETATFKTSVNGTTTNGTLVGQQAVSVTGTSIFNSVAPATFTLTSTDSGGGFTVVSNQDLLGTVTATAQTGALNGVANTKALAGTVMTAAYFTAVTGLTISVDKNALAAGEISTFSTAGTAGTVATALKVNIAGAATFATAAGGSNFTVTATGITANTVQITNSANLFNRTTGELILAAGTTSSKDAFASITGLALTQGTVALKSGETSTFSTTSSGAIKTGQAASLSGTASFATSTGGANFTVTATDKNGGFTVTNDVAVYNATTGALALAAGATSTGAAFTAATGLTVATGGAAINVGETSSFSTVASGTLADTQAVAISGNASFSAQAGGATFTVTSTDAAGGFTVSTSADLLDSAGNVLFATTDTTVTDAATFAAKTGLTLTLTANASKAGETSTFSTSSAGTDFAATKTATAYTGASNFQVGANNTVNDQVTVDLSKAYDTASLGLGGTGNLNTAANASAYIDIAKAAMDKLISQRADLGATQNQIGFILSNLATSIEQTRASVSAIKDADMAAQMAEFTKNKILTQAGTAMLAQANQAAQNILTLFR